ncbi:hypothetical protein [Corynebacterium aurimucosum]|uniref:Putative membrane protein n=1 Tax=Corynebacterium aurimucosum (strain ATCC 700975 / DSM 44827 / CIP 107346 / CN-1) TaxID=548476 RepID=C3PFC7_CORA7|nr:hypothetical protein [Corynebacterium aurimucosum]ACP32531.1 putative membrane protein [Corynebacterium aurimucosum ATCC 700975]QQU93290.1 hypothetical protein I6I67_00950 [Corynebacterium aurimucosum]
MSFRTSVLALSTAVAVSTGAFAAPVATAATYPSAGSVPVAELDVNLPNGALAYVFAEPVMQSDIDLVTRQVRELRGKAWDDNLPFNGGTLRQAASAAGYRTRDAYVNSISWDRGLEHAAMQRAAEENLDFNHLRLPGVPPFGVIDNLWAGENLTTSGMSEAIASWSTDKYQGASEWDMLIRSNGKFNDRTGHLYSIIDPTHVTFAQAQVGEVTAGFFSNRDMSGEPARISGRHAFPIAVSESEVNGAELMTTGGTSVGSEGRLGLTIDGIQGAKLGVPVASPSSSDPEVLEVNEDGTYTAKSEGTATVTFNTYALHNGQPRLSANQVTKTVKVTKKSLLGSSSSGGSEVGTIVGIIAGLLALIGVAAQVARQFGILR